MEYKNEIEAEELGGGVFSLIPVEHLVIDTIDRLGDYLHRISLASNWILAIPPLNITIIVR